MKHIYIALMISAAAINVVGSKQLLTAAVDILVFWGVREQFLMW